MIEIIEFVINSRFLLGIFGFIGGMLALYIIVSIVGWLFDGGTMR